MKKVFLLLLILSFQVSAQTSDLSKEKFCQDRLQNPNSMQNLLKSTSNQLSFTNYGGLLGGGVCWWHSRFTRNAAFLAHFRPELPKPTREEAKDIIMAIRSGKEMTIVPGYRNLQDFSYEWGTGIQSKLQDWQKSDGFLKQKWVKGFFSGNSKESPEKMQGLMDDLFERVSAGEVVYQMLQLSGPVAHAWLVVGMTKQDSGYVLTVVDSNVGTDMHMYTNGQSSMTYLNGTKYVPYTRYDKEERKLRAELEAYCSAN